MKGELISPAGSERAPGRIINSMMRHVRRPASIRMLGFLVAADMAVLTAAAWAADAHEKKPETVAACADVPCVTIDSTRAVLFNGGLAERPTVPRAIDTGTSTTWQRPTTTTSTTTTALPPTTTTTSLPAATTTTVPPPPETTTTIPDLMDCHEILEDMADKVVFAGSYRAMCMDGEPPLGECDTMTPVDACAYPEEDVIRLWFDDPLDRAKGTVVHGYWRFVIAHEAAHAIQDVEGILQSGRFTPDELEIQADNYARALGLVPPEVFKNDDPKRPYRATDQGAIETCRLFEAGGNDYC